MTIKLDNNCFFIFDLDDTLYNELDYVKSGYKAISNYLEPLVKEDLYYRLFEKYSHNQKEDIFQWIVDNYPNIVTKKKLFGIYRNHIPCISLNSDSESFINTLKKRNIKMGIITDGRSITQRNKLKALKIDDYFSEIIISEELGTKKPDRRNYEHFEYMYPCHKFYYFGDNLEKDFISPVQLGWSVFCLLDKGYNIHSQDVKIEYKDKIIFIESFDDIKLLS